MVLCTQDNLVLQMPSKILISELEVVIIASIKLSAII